VEYRDKSDISNNIGATETMSKSFGQYLRNTPGKHEIKELQKPVILDTAHTLREVLM
jgi:hypothetical protein